MIIIKIIGIIIMNIISVILIIKNFRVAFVNKRKLEAMHKCMFLFFYIFGCIAYIAHFLLYTEYMNLVAPLLLIAMANQYIAYQGINRTI